MTTEPVADMCARIQSKSGNPYRVSRNNFDQGQHENAHLQVLFRGRFPPSHVVKSENRLKESHAGASKDQHEDRLEVQQGKGRPSCSQNGICRSNM